MKGEDKNELQDDIDGGINQYPIPNNPRITK